MNSHKPRDHPFDRGEQLGPYEIVELLGTGAMGEVYRARDPRIGREVAIKVIVPEVAGDSEHLERFEQEARAAGALNHPNILVIHDIGHQNESPYLVSELLEGQTLRDRISAGPIALKRTLDLAVQITDGLVAAHEKGIIHRDLKPENIFINRDGRVKILDFGLAKLSSLALQETSRGANVNVQEAVTKRPGTEIGRVMGTVGYMSPEQVRGEKADHRADIFSFGAILYEMLSGKRAFNGETALDKMDAILNEDPPPIVNVSVPVPLRWIIEHSLAKEPSERYAATTDLNHDLRKVRDHFADVSSSGLTPIAVSKKRNLLPVFLLGCVLLLIGLTAASFLIPPPHTIDLSTFKTVRLSDGTRYESYGAWSPDGDSIAYSSAIDGILQVFTRRLNSPLATQLTQSRVDCQVLFWSADGRRIYYLSSPDFDYEPGDLFVVGAAGSEPQMLVKNVFSAAISGDGSALYFLRLNEDQSTTLWTSSPPGAAPVRFTKPPFDKPFRGDWLSFSPDGSRLGVLIDNRDSAQFWTIEYPDGKPQRIVSDLPSSDLSRFSWMSTRSIIFGKLDRIWLLDLRSGKHFPITGDTKDEIIPSASSDGRILFTSIQRQYDVVQVSLEDGSLQDLVATDLTEGAPSFSPDGSLLAYSSRRNASDVILLRNTADKSEKVLAMPSDFRKERIYLSRLAFSPDGKRIAYKAWNDTGPGPVGTIYISTINGGPPIPLLSNNNVQAQSSPSWSPDGIWITYIAASYTPLASWNLMKIKVLSDERPLVLKKDIGYHHPQWSPRGDWIACRGNDGLYLFSPDGIHSRLLNNETWITYGWSKNGDMLFGIMRNDKSHLVVASIDATSGSERILGDLGPAPIRIGWDPVMGFSLLPDGKSFATSILREKADLWILDGIRPPRTFWDRLTAR